MSERDIKVVHAFPPNFELIQAALPGANETHTYCYGDTIYAPDGHEVLPDTVFHEAVHTRQQGQFPDLWWAKYLTDPNFRLSQELEAYGLQYKWICDHIEGSNAFKKWILADMARALSGEVYGNLIGYAQAASRIRNYAR